MKQHPPRWSVITTVLGAVLLCVSTAALIILTLKESP